MIGDSTLHCQNVVIQEKLYYGKDSRMRNTHVIRKFIYQKESKLEKKLVTLLKQKKNDHVHIINVAFVWWMTSHVV